VIGYLKGKILDKQIESNHALLLVEVNGVGYEVLVSLSIAQKKLVQDLVELFIHTHFREDALELFGFSSSWEKTVFRSLMTVSGIGAKTALNILSNVSPNDLLVAIIKQDTKFLTSLNGVGKKTAERIVLELKDKAHKLMQENSVEIKTIEEKAVASTYDLQILNEALLALVSLGFKESEVKNVLKELTQNKDEAVSLSVEELIKNSLKKLKQQSGAKVYG
jgi:Holliday junction DNA helicase RuvA